MIDAQLRALWLNRELQRNSGLAFASTMAALLVGIISAPVLAQLLPKEEYGALSYVASLQGLVMAFSAPGLVNAISYSVARGYEAHFRDGTLRRARIYLRNGLVLLLVACWYLWREQKPELALLIALGGGFLPWSYAFDTGEQFLVGRADFTTIFWRRILSVITIAGSGIAAAYLFPTALSVFLGRSLVSTVMYISIFLILLRTVRNDRRDVEFEQKSRDFSIVSIAGSVATLTDRLILGTIGDLSLLAGYSLALSLSAPMESITKSLNKIAFGRMALPRAFPQRYFWVLLSLLVVLAGSAGLVVAWRVALPLVSMLFPKYPEIGSMVPVLLVTEVFKMGASLGLVYSQFHSFTIWKRFMLFCNVSWIPVISVAVLTVGVWGGLWTRFAYSVLAFVFFNMLLWRGAGRHSHIDTREGRRREDELYPPSDS